MESLKDKDPDVKGRYMEPSHLQNLCNSMPVVFIDNESRYCDDDEMEKLRKSLKQIYEYSRAETFKCTSLIEPDTDESQLESFKASEKNTKEINSLMEGTKEKFHNIIHLEKNAFAKYQMCLEIVDDIMVRFFDKYKNTQAAAEWSELYSLVNKNVELFLSDARSIFFGKHFLSIQEACLRHDTRWNLKHKYRKCPNCQMPWYNEGGCQNRRCGVQDASLIGTASYGCGKPFDWRYGEPVTEDELSNFWSVDVLPGYAGLWWKPRKHLSFAKEWITECYYEVLEKKVDVTAAVSDWFSSWNPFKK